MIGLMIYHTIVPFSVSAKQDVLDVLHDREADLMVPRKSICELVASDTDMEDSQITIAVIKASGSANDTRGECRELVLFSH